MLLVHSVFSTIFDSNCSRHLNASQKLSTFLYCYDVWYKWHFFFLPDIIGRITECVWQKLFDFNTYIYIIVFTILHKILYLRIAKSWTYYIGVIEFIKCWNEIRLSRRFYRRVKSLKLSNQVYFQSTYMNIYIFFKYTYKILLYFIVKRFTIYVFRILSKPRSFSFSILYKTTCRHSNIQSQNYTFISSFILTFKTSVIYIICSIGVIEK